MIAKLLLLAMLLPTTLWASTLTIKIRDVLDLASYQDVATKSIKLEGTQDKAINFTVNTWAFNDDQSYSIKVTGNAKYMDEGTYYVKFKKALYQGGTLVKVLLDKQFVLNESEDTFSTNDSFWGPEGLVIRQENTVQIR